MILLKRKLFQSSAGIVFALLAFSCAAAAGARLRPPWAHFGGQARTIEATSAQEQAPQSGKAEETLKSRVGEFYGFLQVGNWTRAESYLTEESKETFRSNPKQTFPGFRFQSAHIESGGTTASVVVAVQHFMPAFPNPVFVPETTDWRLVNGSWYMDLARRPAATDTPAPSAGPEELKFQGHRYGLGTMQEGEVKVARFPFTNVADHTVTVSEVITGCACLKATLAKKEYKPGESGELVITFDSNGYRLGFAQSVVVMTEPGNHASYLLVFARVMPPLPPPPPAKPKPESPKPPNP